MRHIVISSSVILAFLLASCGQAPKETKTETFFRSDSTAYSGVTIDVDLPVASTGVSGKIRETIVDVLDNNLTHATSYEGEKVFESFSGDRANSDALLTYYLGKLSELFGRLSDEDITNRKADIEENENMTEEEKKEALSYIPSWSYDASLKKIHETPECVVFLSEDYIYMGGAHGGVRGQGGITFDKATGERVVNIVDPEKVEDLQPALEKGILQYFKEAGYEEEPENVMDYLLIDDETIPLPSWEPYPSETGLEFVYQQYEIASYALGMPAFTVPFSEIAPYLTPDGKRICGIKE